MQELGPAEGSFIAPPPVILRLDRRIVARWAALVDAARGLAEREQIRGLRSTARDLNPILRSSLVKPEDDDLRGGEGCVHTPSRERATCFAMRGTTLILVWRARNGCRGIAASIGG